VRAALGFRVQAVNDRTQGMLGEFNANQEAANARQAGEVDAYNITSGAASTALNQRIAARFDALNRTQSARLAAINSGIQAAGLVNTARGLVLQAAGVSPAMNAVNTILTTAPAVASKWYSYKKTGSI
jgi:transcriptional regulator of acetoin/glycerol metabolism